MNHYKTLFIFILGFSLLLSCTSIKIPKNEKQIASKCKEVTRVTKELIGADIGIKNGIATISFHPAEVPNKLITKARDGIILELVHRDQYKCDTNIYVINSRYPGLLLKPLWKKDIKENKMFNPFVEGAFAVAYPYIPMEHTAGDYEINIAFIQNRYVCPPAPILNTITRDLDLLEMGLFPYRLTPDSLQKIAEKGIKSEFTIHFKKGSTKIPAEQLHFLLGTLTEIKNIREIEINGYASIDGSRKVNEEIFRGRAEVIQKALQEQYPNIKIRRRSTENWQDFIDDIQNTSYAFLATRPKSTIKRIMEERDLYDELEPMLEGHRKVVIITTSSIPLESEKEIKEQFSSAYQEADLARLLFIQEEVMNRIERATLPAEFAKELEVPQSVTYAPVIMNQLINLQRNGLNDLNETYEAIKELNQLVPNDPTVIYNYLALSLKIFLAHPAGIDKKAIDHLFHKLIKTNLDQSLINRLKVNYYLILVSEEYRKGNQKKVNKYLSGINNLYKDAEYDENDLLSLANYFSKYNNDKYAEAILYPVVKEGTSNETLIFFYIQLTYNNPKIYKQQWHKDLLVQAHSINPIRFCKMFDNSNKGGISFQLLRFKNMKKAYCDLCIN